MRVAILLLAAPLMLAACGADPSPDEQRISDEEAVATLEALSQPPAVMIKPEAIRYPDIERHNLYGAGCAFAPKGGGIAAIALTKADSGYMKVDGAIRQLAPDLGSDEQPLGTRMIYAGTTLSFALELLDKEGTQSGMETSDFDARLIVRDTLERVVYQADGIAQCGV